MKPIGADSSARCYRHFADHSAVFGVSAFPRPRLEADGVFFDRADRSREGVVILRDIMGLSLRGVLDSLCPGLSFQVGAFF